MSWLKRLGEASKRAAAARISAGKSRTGSKLKPKAEGDPGKLGGSLPSEILSGQVKAREDGYTVVYTNKLGWFQTGSKDRKQPARRVIGLSKAEIASHREAAAERLRVLGRRLGVFR